METNEDIGHAEHEPRAKAVTFEDLDELAIASICQALFEIEGIKSLLRMAQTCHRVRVVCEQRFADCVATFCAGSFTWHTVDWRGRLHNGGDEPAVVFDDVDDVNKEWWRHGKRHRGGDLPAFYLGRTTLQWCWKGRRHREGDRPAVIVYRDEALYRCLRDVEHGRATEREVLDGLASEIERQEWWRHGERHRKGGLPAVVGPDGLREWWRNGVRYYPSAETGGSRPRAAKKRHRSHRKRGDQSAQRK